MKKKCSKCDEMKELNEFYVKKTGKDNLMSQCKLCIKRYGEKYRKKNVKVIKLRKQKYYIQNTITWYPL